MTIIIHLPVIITQHWVDVTEGIDGWHLFLTELNSIKDSGSFPTTIDNVFSFCSSHMVVELDQPTGMNGFELCQLPPNLNIFNTYIFVRLRFNLSRIPLDKFAFEVSFSVTIDCQVKRLAISGPTNYF